MTFRKMTGFFTAAILVANASGVVTVPAKQLDSVQKGINFAYDTDDFSDDFTDFEETSVNDKEPTNSLLSLSMKN